MFCKQCGNKIENNEEFCTGCGMSSNNHQQKNDKEQMKRASEKNEEPFDWSKTVKILIGIAIIGWVIYANIDQGAIDTNNQGLTSFNSGDSVQAVQQLKEAVNSAVSSDTKINTLKNLGYAYSSDGQNVLALNSFKEALALAKVDTFDYYLISGEIAMLENKPNSALVNYNKALAIEPNNFQINNTLNLFYLDLEDKAPSLVNYPKALVYAKKAYEVAGSEVKNIVTQNLGLAHYFNENYPQAIANFSAVTSDKDSYTALWLGMSYAGNNEPVNAKFYLRKAIASGKVEIPQEVYDYINNN